MYSKSDSTEIMMNDEADEVIEEPFESLKKRYQNKFKESVEGSEFVSDYVHLLYYKCPNRGRPYIDSLATKNPTINPINKKDNKCFQYAVTLALNHEKKN